MRKFSAALLVVLLATSAAYAHRDRILRLTPNGSIPEIPAIFGRAYLTVSGLGTDNPLIQLKIGTHQTTLPACVARLIRTTSQKDIRLTGSWYHDESVLPYYININFYDPDRSSYYKILYNLHNARIIELKRFNSKGGPTDVILSASCKSALKGMWSDNSFNLLSMSLLSLSGVAFGLCLWILVSKVVRRSPSTK
jgi:hypothetical protein